MDTTESLRRKLEEVDRGLVGLLDDRARLVQQLVAAAGGQGTDVFHPGTEKETLGRLAASGAVGGFPSEGLNQVFVEILSVCRNLVGTDRVGVLGEKYGWVHEAALRALGSSTELSCYDDSEDLVGALERGDVGLAFLNVDGRAFAGIHLLLENILAKPFGILAQSRSVPGFCLATRSTGARGEIKTLFVTREVMPVIRHWLEKQVSMSVKIRMCQSIEEVVENLAEEKPVGGIVPSALARHLELNAVEVDLGGRFAGPLRFMMLARQERIPAASGAASDLVSMLMALPNRPGAMAEIISSVEGLGMAVQGVMSYEYANRAWRNLYLLDVSRPQDPGVLPHLYRVLETRALVFKPLGCYPTFEPGQRVTWPPSSGQR